MGEVGTALADDESALFFNPAGLANSNSNWKSGEVNMSTGHLLPMLFVRDLWSSSISGYYQPQKLQNGGFGSFLTYVNMGLLPCGYNQNGIWHSQFTNQELISAFGYGHTFHISGNIMQNAGIS